MPPYNRTAAIDYARNHWDRPCDDGVIGTSDALVSIERKRVELQAPAADGWEAHFVSNGRGAEKAVFNRTVGGLYEEKLIQDWEGLADCAHFLSKCLSAGGVHINELIVPKLVRTLQERTDTKTLCEKVTRDRGQAFIDSGLLKLGDVIAYFNVDPQGDYGGRRSYTHSTMYAGKLNANSPGSVTCHAVARFPGLSFVPDEWFLHDGYLYTFIHISSDDPPLAAVAGTLTGWWKVQYTGRAEYYYYIFRDGRARYTLRAPRTRHELHGGEGSAYWFPQGSGTVAFGWRTTGTFELWSPRANGTEYTTRAAQLFGTATKMVF